MPEEQDAQARPPLRTLAASKESVELRRHYLQNLVHELSTPLTPLLGYLKLFEKGSLGPLTAIQERALDRMRHATARLHRVLDDLGYLLHMETGTYEPDLDPVDVGELLEHVLRDTASSAAEEQIEVLTEVDLDVEVYGDEPRLRTAIEHLVWNGLKFNTAGGKLLIRAGLRGADDGSRPVVRIEVFDTGVGIKEDELERVFDPFFQSDHSATRQFGGAGLGLSLVRWIVDRHGGRVYLESPPSSQPQGHFFRGVRAVVELPVRK